MKIKFLRSAENALIARGFEIYVVCEGYLGGDPRFSIAARLNGTTGWTTMCQSEFESTQNAGDAIYETGFDVSPTQSAHGLANTAIVEGLAVRLL